jgi:hypothetical protein
VSLAELEVSSDGNSSFDGLEYSSTPPSSSAGEGPIFGATASRNSLPETRTPIYGLVCIKKQRILSSRGLAHEREFHEAGQISATTGKVRGCFMRGSG